MTRLLALVATLALFIASVTLAEAQVVNPTISTVAVTSDPGTDDTYALGDNVDVELTFSEAIAVTGAPYLVIDVGGTNRRADYHGTSSDNLTVTFRYTVLAGDDDDDGIAVVANSLVLNDGTIRNSADTADATLDHAALTTTDHKVDIVVTLLSNFGQTASSSNETISATQYAVFEFTVGENSGGYQLDSVVVDVKSPSDTLVVEARIHTGTSELYSNPDASEPKATLRGSVTSAGRQTFTMDPGPSGNLVPTGPEFKGKYYLVIVGSGSGTVQLGRVAGDGEDSGNSAGWVIEGAPDFIEGVDNPLDYNYLKVDVRGHPGAIPYLRAASVRSTPLNGHTYHAGEHIEIIVQTSVPVTPSNVPGRLPLWLGIGEEFYRGARPVAAYFRHDYSWSVLAVYEVREGDTDTDGVVLDDQLVWDNNSPIWTNALDTTVPISHSLEFATIDTGPEHPVDGSQKWGCEQLLCASAQFFQEYADHFGVFSNEGSISNRYFRYLDEDYVFITMIHGPSTRRDYFVTFLHLSPALTGSEQVVAQGAIVFSGTVLPLRDSYRELRGANSFGWPYQDTFIRWERAVVSWTEGEAPLIKLVENVDVSFATDIYTVDEDGTIEVEITLSLGLGRDVTVPITVMNQNGASDEDYDAPEELTIEAGLTSKKFVITPVDDELDDDGESLLLEFGDLPENLSPGTTTEAVVTIIDNDDPEVEVSFEQATHTVAESDDTSTTEVAENQVVVKVILSADPERTVVIPLAETLQGGATSGDYSGVPANVVFNSGDTEKTFTFTATDDTVDDDDESVRLGFGTLPDRVSEGATAEAVVNITDDDAPESVAVSFGDTSYTVTEGSGVQVTVLLDDDPEQTIRVPIFSVGVGATGVDYDVPVVVEFNAGETSATITLQAIDDEIDDDDESVRLGFGPALPEGVTQRTPATTEVFIIDNDLAGDSLLSLVVAPKDVDGFDPEVTDYMVGLASTITRATITATPAQQDATVAIDGTQVTSGSAHAVDLSAGLNTFEVVVTSADNEQTTYTVHIGRGTTAHGGWKAGDDLDTLRSAGNTSPAGAWSNGTTIWISDVSNAKLYAYSQADGVRVPGKDIALSGATMAPTGIWSDGTAMWVIGPVEATVFAYTLSSGARDLSSDISLGSELMLPVDMWSDGVTMWVLDSHGDKLYAYPLSGEARDAQGSDKDIDLAGDNAAPRGVWSNGTTIWVTDIDDRKLYAYNFSGERVAGHDIDLHSRNADPAAIWGNADTLWAANNINDVSSPFNRVFTYNNISVEVSFGQSSYTVAESDDTSTTDVVENAVEVTVTLSADPKRQVVVPITVTDVGATGADYSGLPESLTFESGETEKRFTFTATHDTLDDDDESVHITFGTLPPGVIGGTNAESVVSITDDDNGVSFERMGYEATEGDSVDVKVVLTSPATREVTIQLDTDKQGGASEDDYSGVQDSITFRSSDTETIIRFTAVDDEDNDDGESVTLRFGTLPPGLVPGPNTEATVTITDNDMPTDRLMSLVVAPKDIDGFDTEVTDYMVGLASTVTQATITATPHRTDDTVTINGAQVTGGSAHTVDLSAGLNSFEVIVDSAATQEQTTYTVYIGRGTTDQGGWKAGDDLDTLRSPGNTSPTGAWSNGTTIWISDPGDAKLYAYTLADGPRDSTRDITLDSNNGNPVGIWSDNTTIWVAELMPTERKVYAYTLADGSRDSDKDITLRGGNTTSWGIWSDGTTMWVADWNDDELYAYTLAGDTSDSDKDITLLGDNTSPRGIWSDGTSIWIVDSSGVKLYAYDLSGGNRVPGYDISLHSSNEGASGIWANDDTAWVVNSATEDGSPFDRVFTYNNIPVKVSFESATYTAAEGSSVTVKVTLSSDPERTVVIPLTAAPQGDTSGDDYSVPSSVTFNAGETTKDVTFIAEMDDADDDGESVRIGFGTSLPAGVTPESPTTTTVSITDDDDPQVTVRFGQASYTVAEGADQTITVNLSADPERTLVIPLTATRQGDTSGDDYSVPGTVTFNTGETSRDITFTATQDDIDDDNESVLLGFGTLPDRVSEATPTEATLSITDDDARGVMVSTITLDVDEGENATYTVVLKSEPTHDVRVTINDPIDNTKVTADPPSLTFTSSDWDTPQTVTVSAAQDEDGANESATVTHTVGGGDYASETLQDVTVTVDDDETTSVTIDPKGITIQPGESNQYSVVLGTEPTVPVTVTVTGHSGTDLLVNPDDLNFDENDWDVPKTVRVSARGSASTDIITLSHTPAGGEYDSVTADDVSVAIVKGSGALTHQVGITASPQSLTVPEGQSSTYSVVLGTIPTADVTVTVNLPTGNDLGVNKPELTFTTGNWNVLQDVRVTAAEDDDGIADNPVTILHTVSGGGYTSSQNFNIVVTIDENDIPGVTPSTVSLVMAEGEMDTYTLKLDTEPSGDVTVTINDPTDNTDVKAEPASLTFTTLNWSAAQTVTVKTEVDHDTVLDTATVTHSVRGGDYGAVTVKDVRVTVTDGCQSFWCGVLEMEKSDRFPEELSFVSLDDDDWDYNNQYYRLNHNVALYGGGQPATTGVPTVAIPERAWLRLEVLGPLQETEHYLDWTLEVNGVELPFSEAKSVWADLPGHWRILFRWYGREFYDLFPPGDDGTGTTLYLSIKETLRANRAATVLGPPLYLTLGPSAANGKNLWASWVRPQMRNDDDHRIYVDKYKIQWKKSSGSWTNPSDVSQETLTPAEASVRYGHAIGGLTPGLDYDVRVIATNGAGDSGPSNVASATVEPVRPRKISMKVVNGKVALTFDRPMDDTSVPAVDTFRVRIGGITLNDVTNVAISGSVVTLTVTTPLHDRAIYGVSYQEPADAADTRLVDQVGNAAVSFGNWVQAQTELRVNTPATGAPGISGLPEVGETLTATTSGIEDEDGLENAVFAYQWLRFELGANSGADIAGATGPTYTLTADDEDKVIKVRVTFTDDAGNEESVISSIGMLVSAALPEPGVPDAPGAPDVSPHAAGALAVSWTAPASDGGSAITGYRVQWKEAAGSWDTPADVTEATVTGTSHTIAGLTDGTAYSVRVLAINDNGEGSTSEDGEGTPHETVPPELSGASVDGAALTLTFNEALDEDSNPAPSAFTVTVSGNTRAVDSVDVSGSDVTLTLASAVTSEDTVTVSYAAPTGESDTRLRDAVGNAAASFTGQTATNETAPPAAQAPDAPGRPDVARHASGSLSVSWDAPSSDGGSPITGYKVQWKAAANSWDTPADVSEAAVTGTGHTIAGLTDGVEYSVRVIAANEAGGSPPSTEQTGTPNETVPPALSTATVDGATLTLNYNEALDDSSAPAASAFTVMVGVNDRGVESVDVTGSAVTLTLASAVTPEDEVVVSYAAPADESAERLRDEAGNPASSFTGEPVTNETGPPPPFTASIHDAPDSHDGQTAFTFELRLSEAPNRGFSYKTLKFHAFNVEGGTVKKAQRMEKGNNMRWTIHVEPDSSADVTVVLPATEDCDAEGAICSGDGRMLSSRLELTVSGPGG